MTPIPRPHIRMGKPAGPQPGTPVVLALGSNLGDRAGTITQAVREIGEIDGLELTGISSLYESAAVKLTGVDSEAPVYLNAVVTVSYTGEPETLLAAVNRIEADHGRERTERWGDRTLDIDIVAFGTLTRADDHLTLPHPRAAERDFVLVPWLETDPDAVIPGRGRVADLVAGMETTVRVFPGDDR